MKDYSIYAIPIALMAGAVVALVVLLTMQETRAEVCEAANAVLVADHYCLPKTQLLNLRSEK